MIESKCAGVFSIFRTGVRPVEWRQLTTAEVGDKIETYFRPESLEALRAIRRQYPDALPVGNGSNILPRHDGLYVRPVVDLKGLNAWRPTETGYVAQGGVLARTLVTDSVQRGLHGLEWAVGIPATVGGLSIMNAGAHGSAMAECIEKLTVMDASGQLHVLGHDEIAWRYHKKNLPPELWIVEVQIRLQPSTVEAVRALTRKNQLYRKKSQPLQYPSAGCMFRNPEGGYSAGRLIDECQLKGYRVGDASVSDIHANFLVNLGQASASDCWTVIDHVQRVVLAQKGVALENEIEAV